MITSMEGVTVYNTKTTYKVGISARKIEPIDEADFKSLHDNIDGFWQLEKIEKKRDTYFFDYIMPARAKSFYDAKKCNEIMVLALLYNFLKADFLEKSNTIVHPQNIFFTTLTDISMMYRDNGALIHEDKLPVLDQYKALCVSMLTKYSYEKVKDTSQRKAILEKLKNTFLNTLERCEDKESLKELIYARYIRQESDYFIYLEKEERAVRNKKLRNITIMATAVLIACGIVSAYYLGVML